MGNITLNMGSNLRARSGYWWIRLVDKIFAASRRAICQNVLFVLRSSRRSGRDVGAMRSRVGTGNVDADHSSSGRARCRHAAHRPARNAPAAPVERNRRKSTSLRTSNYTSMAILKHHRVLYSHRAVKTSRAENNSAVDGLAWWFFGRI